MTSLLASALKEWNVAVNALIQGETILLLRKGGIREESGKFHVAHRQVWLFPTYEHQKPHLLKPAYRNEVTPVMAGWHPEQVDIQAWTEITHIFQAVDAETINSLLPFHIGNEQFVTERLHWKPRQPLYLLLLRVHRLEHVQPLFYSSSYGGCRSWIELEAPLPPQPAFPVLTDEEYGDRVAQIQSVLG